MKSIKSLTLFLLILTFVSCSNDKKEENQDISTDLVNNPASASSSDNNQKLPVIAFETEVYDFGTITQGEKTAFAFKFKNTGNADLIISEAKGSCGCTVPEYSDKPVAPGDEGVVNVVFDSHGKSDKQEKKVTIITNANPNTKVLTIKGFIKAPESK